MFLKSTQFFKSFLFYLLPVTLAIFIVCGAIYAWVDPSASPPPGNIAAPINVGSQSQTKLGSLTVSSLSRAELGGANGGIYAMQGGSSYAGQFVGTTYFNGNVGIGISNPNYKLDVVDSLAVGRLDWTRMQMLSSYNDTWNPITGNSDRAHFHFSFPGVPGGKEPLLETPSDLWIIGANHNLKVDGKVQASGDICTNTGGGKCLSSVGNYIKGGLYGYCTTQYFGCSATFPAYCNYGACACSSGFTQIPFDFYGKSSSCIKN